MPFALDYMRYDGAELSLWNGKGEIPDNQSQSCFRGRWNGLRMMKEQPFGGSRIFEYEDEGTQATWMLYIVVVFVLDKRE